MEFSKSHAYKYKGIRKDGQVISIELTQCKESDEIYWATTYKDDPKGINSVRSIDIDDAISIENNIELSL